jgi:peptidoglycan/LPS O-acetylase OafA/YrhL
VGNGWMGVDLFFALSGFLITGILLDAKHSPDYFRNFYARRALRILPLYYFVLVFMFVAVPLLRPAEAHTIFEKSSPWWGYPLFLQNFLIAVPTMAAGPLGVTWSLAIEEQFYLVWPLVVRYCSAAKLRRIAISSIVVSPALSFYLSLHHVHIYSNVLCRMVGLMAGALLAVIIRSEGYQPSRYLKPAWILFFIALTAAFVSEDLDARWFAYTMVALASSSFIFLALHSQQAWLQAALRNRFLIYSGQISYGLYLLHKIPFDMAQSFRLDRHFAIALPLMFAGAYVLAALSWNLLEQPFLKLKKFFVPQADRTTSLEVLFAYAPHGEN